MVCIGAWTFACLWSSAFALLWHMGAVQPYVKQFLVYIYIILGVCTLLGVVFLEYFNTVSKLITNARNTVMYLHDKIDDALESIGLDALESEQDRLDAEKAEKAAAKNPAKRVIREAKARSAARHASDERARPAPGTPAWVVSTVRKTRGGCC